MRSGPLSMVPLSLGSTGRYIVDIISKGDEQGRSVIQGGCRGQCLQSCVIDFRPNPERAGMEGIAISGGPDGCVDTTLQVKRISPCIRKQMLNVTQSIWNQVKKSLIILEWDVVIMLKS